MANNLTSNIMTKVAEIFTDEFQSTIVSAKSVNTQIIEGMHNAATGDTVYLKRPHQYNAINTSDGDISLETKSSIIAGRVPATVQNYITVAMEWSDVEESTKLNQLDEIIRPAARKCVIELEARLNLFGVQNLGLTVGTPGNAVAAWSDISRCGAYMKSLGVPDTNEKFYQLNPFTNQNLADVQLGLNSTNKVDSAWEKAQMNSRTAGMLMMESNALHSFTNGVCADRVGAVDAAPTATYVGAKDTMTQTLVVKGLSNAGIIEEGEVIEYSSVYHRNPLNGEIVRGADGQPLKFRQTVKTGVTLDGSGEGSITVTPAGIYEATGQYNNISAAIAENDVITLLGDSGTAYQPNIFYDKNAIGLGTIKLSKLYSTDILITTEDNISIRIAKYSDGDANTQKIRYDIRPTFALLNPFFGGRSYGVPA